MTELKELVNYPLKVFNFVFYIYIYIYNDKKLKLPEGGVNVFYKSFIHSIRSNC